MKLSGTDSYTFKPHKVQQCLACCEQLSSLDWITCAGIWIVPVCTVYVMHVLLAAAKSRVGICCISDSAMRLQKLSTTATKTLTPKARRELLLKHDSQSGNSEPPAGQHVEQPARQPSSKASKHASAGRCPPDAWQYFSTN